MDGLYETKEEEEEFLKIAYQSLKHLLSIINNILDLASLGSGTLDPVYQNIDVSKMLSDFEFLFRKDVEDKGLELRVIASKREDIEFYTDVRMLKQVLNNLIDNSVKFTDKGYIELSTECDKKLNRIIISVKDTGIGIDPKKADMVFQPFVQLDGSSARKFGGTGLGMAICKELVEILNGDIWIESEGKGKGTIVNFTLPLGVPDDA